VSSPRPLSSMACRWISCSRLTTCCSAGVNGA
jgi:hypothetical protein